MNNFIKKARTAEKPLVQTHQEQTDTQKGLSKIEGIITSAIQTKTDTQEPNNQWAAYYLAFFALEGISNQDIPVVFRLKENTKPDIPLRAKVELTGQWVDMNMRHSSISTRPSFTCSYYRILANPPPITIKSLREQISSLLTTSLDKKQEWQQRTDYLFKKQKDLSEIDKLIKLGPEYLQAYLLLRRAFYANYQDNLLPLSQFNQPEYLTKIAQEIEDIACQVRAYMAKDGFSEPPKPLQNPWTILQKDYNPRPNCQHLVEPNLTCGKYGQCLLLKPQKGGREKWICAEHAQSYQIVGDWAKTWLQDFKVNLDY